MSPENKTSAPQVTEAHVDRHVRGGALAVSSGPIEPRIHGRPVHAVPSGPVNPRISDGAAAVVIADAVLIDPCASSGDDA